MGRGVRTVRPAGRDGGRDIGREARHDSDRDARLHLGRDAPRDTDQDDGGAVLVVVVLMTLALMGLAHGLLISAEGAYLTSRVHARTVELDSWVGGVVEEELRRGWAPWMDSVAVSGRRTGARDSLGGPPTSVVWRRLSTESWLVEVEATSEAGWTVGRRRLAWVYDPATRVAAFPGVVSVGPDAPVELSGSVVPDTVAAVGVVARPASGLLTFARVSAVADRGGWAGTPGPVEAGGVCDFGSPWNWGDPIRPYRPCGGHFPIKGRVGPLVVEGGQGQGVLVVDGDVTLQGGTVFHGLVLASGRVDVLEGSVVEGRIVAFGGVVVESGAAVVGSPVRAEAALDAARARLGSAVLLHPATRLGPE
jgi:hypothetical protein